MLECVINVSEGRRHEVLEALRVAGGACCLDVHRDPFHHRAVFTLGGPTEEVEQAARRLVRLAVERLDLAHHTGVHPRHGVVDVVPWVPLGDGPHVSPGLGLDEAVRARDRFARWAAEELEVSSSLYGPGAGQLERPTTLPELRARLRRGERPDIRPAGWEGADHAGSDSDSGSDSGSIAPDAGVMAVGARSALVAYNIWLECSDVASAQEIARTIRRPALRTLGLQVGGQAQVSCNLVEPWEVGPLDAYGAVTDEAAASGINVARTELVGLVPCEVLQRIPSRRWRDLDLAEEKTIERRMADAWGPPWAC